MGVPGLFKHFVKKYPNIVLENTPPIDFLYIDFNAIIHRSAKPFILPPIKKESDIFENIKLYLENIYRLIQPKKLIFISVDGVAPRAKINQQRSRRYENPLEKLSINNKNKSLYGDKDLKKDNIVDILEDTQPIGIPEAEISDISEEYLFESNNITTGTEFMDRMEEYMHSFLKYKLSKDWKNITVIYSSSKVPGEGEQKILDFMRKQKSYQNFNHMIYSPDADLILLSLFFHETNVYLMRNNHRIEERHKRNFCSKCNVFSHNDDFCGRLDLLKYVFMDVSCLKEHIYAFFKRFIRREYCPKKMLHDFVFACSFAGNDFIPNLPCLDVSFGGIDNIFFILTYNYNLTGLYLTEEGEVNFMGTKSFLKTLARYEDSYYFKKLQNLRKIRERFTSIMPENQTVPEEVINLNTEETEPNIELLIEQEKEIEEKIEAERLTQTEIQPIYEEIFLHTETGKSIYYADKLHLKTSQEVESICDAYLRQICWIFRYYYSGFVCWESFFPYHYAPFVSDLANLKEFDNKFDTNSSLSPLEQLVCIMPPNSKDYIPQELIKIHDEFPEYYPSSTEFDMFDKLMFYQAVSTLPFMDLNKVLPKVAEILENSDVKTLWLNAPDLPTIYVNSDTIPGTKLLQMYMNLKTHYIYEFDDVKVVVKPHFRFNLEEYEEFDSKEYETKCIFGYTEVISGKYLRRV
ncbi:hypothetical protein H312_00133 [Anncaliia algerae PRA339]|uniref:Uncharacterized protein n=1 Tax=Anncaliia algerae PRA339 TaxID=1288291 RepID=A0A059F5K3_9MICR|nr:hypothetical protein H312_00133 [Anncaliia algerae PRA339]